MKKACKSLRLPQSDASSFLESGRLGSVAVLSTAAGDEAAAQGPASAHPFYEGLGVAGGGRRLELWWVKVVEGTVKVRRGTPPPRGKHLQRSRT